MNILILPFNMASMPAITAEALNKIEGVNAKSLTIDLHKYQTTNSSTIYIPRGITKRTPVRWLWHKLTFRRKLYNLLKWADVLHYHWNSIFPDNEDLKWIGESGKPILVEWVGSEIRIPDICKKINPYYARVFDHGYEYNKLENREGSLALQKKFSDFHAIPLIIPEMTLYVQKQMFPVTYPSQIRINVKKFIPAFPDVNKKKPLIIHSPTAKICKGSNIIVPVIEELKKTLNFEFILLHDKTREEVLKIMKEADIFLDQIIVGGYGAAAMEAMSLGKPTMCYIMKEVFEGGLPADCPIINTNPDNLKEQLVRLIENPQLRNDIGIQSRAFAEKYFDVEIIAPQLVNIYKEVLAVKKKTNA
jgi:glycosyltransferase involved in cell wall biosynthesis